MIRTTFKPSRNKKGKRKVSGLYRGKYRIDGETKIHEVALKTADRQIAKHRLEAIIREKQLEAEGMAPSRSQRDAAESVLLDYIKKFIPTRRSVRRDEKYVKELRKKLLRMGTECSWKSARDISAESF